MRSLLTPLHLPDGSAPGGGPLFHQVPIEGGTPDRLELSEAECDIDTIKKLKLGMRSSLWSRPSQSNAGAGGGAGGGGGGVGGLTGASNNNNNNSIGGGGNNTGGAGAGGNSNNNNNGSNGNSIVGSMLGGTGAGPNGGPGAVGGTPGHPSDYSIAV